MNYALLYDKNGNIKQRMTGTPDAVAVTGWYLGLSVLWVEDDHDYERTHRVENGKLVLK